MSWILPLFWIEKALFIFFVLQVGYLLFFAVCSLFRYRPKIQKGNLHSFAILIPGYKEDRIIQETVRRALEQDYPKDLFRVIALADQFQEKTISDLKAMGAEVLEVKFEKSTKAKSLNFGLQFLSRQNTVPDAVVILDADNLIQDGVLLQFSQSLNRGYLAIQGHRTAKNTETPFAVLDAANEEIGNSIFRKGHRIAGLPSALIGSGMCFEFNLFVELMSDIHDVSGEDKLLELKLNKAGIVIEYLPEAYILDEKVANAQNFSKQRTRWVGNQIYYLKTYFWEGFGHFLRTGKLGYFDKLIQFALVFKVLLLGILIPVGVLDLFFYFPSAWDILALALALSMLLSIPRKMYNKKLFMALFQLPGAFFGMIKALRRVDKNTVTQFEVTEKTVTSNK